MKRLQEICRVEPRPASRPESCRQPCRLPVPTRRGPSSQFPKRQREHLLRRNLVSFLDGTAEHGKTMPQIAQRLRLSPRTLRQWHYERYASRPSLPRTLGRPCLRSPRGLRNDVLAVLDELGPATGVPTLRACFPTMARAELEDLLRRYRRVWRKRHQQALHVLHWQVPGAVWAMDFSEATYRVEGRDRYLLAVRDLASAQQLLWWPVPAINTEETLAALAYLFAAHGAPLVLKTDNGSPFCADATLGFLHQAGVITLFSPPRMPRYNGAIEAGIGSLKTRTDQHSTQRGRAGYWTLDDLAAAQDQANTQARPQGPSGPSPEQLWNARRRLTPAQRTLFRHAVDHQRHLIQVQEGLPDDPAQARAQDRPVVRTALHDLGYLHYSRRRLPLPFQKQKVTDIT